MYEVLREEDEDSIVQEYVAEVFGRIGKLAIGVPH